MKTLRPTPLLALPLLLTLLPAALLADGQHGFGHGPRHGGFMAGRIAERLELTDQQRERIGEIRDSYSEEARALLENLGAERRELATAIHADPLDESAIRDAASQVARVEADMAVQRARIFSEIRQILTPEQVEKAEELRGLLHDFATELGGPARRGHGHRFPRGPEESSD